MAKKKAAQEPQVVPGSAQDVAAHEEVAEAAQDEVVEEVKQDAKQSSEPIVSVFVPVEVKINSKPYKGECVVPLSTARLLLEMASAKIEREKNVFVGNKYQVDRSMSGGARIRRIGSV